MAERLTIGVPAFEEAQTIRRTLDSILSQELPPSKEIRDVPRTDFSADL